MLVLIDRRLVAMDDTHVGERRAVDINRVVTLCILNLTELDEA